MIWMGVLFLLGGVFGWAAHELWTSKKMVALLSEYNEKMKEIASILEKR
jgi:hypothetical protein